MAGRKSKSREEKIAEYKGVPFRNAIKKLRKQQELDKESSDLQTVPAPDPIRAKLFKRDCAVLLTLGFNQYTHDGCKHPVKELRQILKSKIDGDKTSGKVFWEALNNE